MNPRAYNDVHRDTVHPEQVTVSCDGCGESFTTDEATAFNADQHDRDLYCSRCEGDGRSAPPQDALENSTVDAVRGSRKAKAGPCLYSM